MPTANKKLKQTGLPIVDQLDNICSILSKQNNLVLQAEPGAGKTTLVPLALLDIIPEDKKILILEPRRLAARNAAVRMAELLNETVGNTVGYRIRNEVKVSIKTRVEVITEGILTRMLQSDPELEKVGLIIFDEFHERSLDADLGLAFLIEVQQSLREDLKILVMSATLDTTAVAKLLNDAPIINCEGRCFPVEIEYLPTKTKFDWLTTLVKAVKKVVESGETYQEQNKTNQDILVFLPGIGEINKAKRQLDELFGQSADIKILSLYGDLPFAQQRQVLLPITNRRKIILSTNIAETSVTIEGVGSVIDSGLMRQSAFDPNIGFNRLRTIKISKASAIQRSGRAGRLGPGHCYRLWSESENLRSETQPEILREDLAGFALELALWGISEPSGLKLLEQPNQGMFTQAQSLLRSLKAIDHNNKITSHGKTLAKLGVHPRIAHMLVESLSLGAVDYACLLAAMLEEKDLLQGEQRNNPDFMARVHILFDPRSNSHVRKQIIKQSKRLLAKLKRLDLYKSIKQNTAEDSKHLTAMLLALVFPDRIAQKRGNGYRLANGGGVIADDDFSIQDDFLVIVKLGGQGTIPKIFQAIGMSLEELENCFTDLIIEREEVIWDDKSQSVKAELNRKFGELLIKSQPIVNPNAELVLNGLLKGIAKKGVASLPWNRELRQWQARIHMLRQFDVFEDEFPEMSDQVLLNSLKQWLAPYLNGLSKISQITSAIFSQAINNRLDWQLQKRLDELMPLTLKVASGSKIKVDYQQGEKPVLAVKLQEMFGEKQTPTIAAGRMKVVVHLLSPARRPLQITEDLESFWANGYVEVKKQMKGKYPKHPWPDDPLQAMATRYTKQKTAYKNN